MTNTIQNTYTLAQILARFNAGPQSGVFTDGGAAPNPGPGGWGFVHVQDGKVVHHAYGRSPDTTNNRMELTAMIEALKYLPAQAEVTVYSDSNICVQTLNDWAAGWERNGWRRKSGPIKNLEMVQELWSLRKTHPSVRFEWVKAHNGWLWNEYADSLATAWMREEL